ncbi:hypothetical protein QJS10_CPB14g01066 [Acorus calamus]|uniref:Uncharacterized protein n=1 Tax=Acorus calamus TaxID=4465 RepID=A0AAV9DCY8_ACOCL|nr:hypothetical protein QJS10_CPB14g01066 [Acorus calamus]
MFQKILDEAPAEDNAGLLHRGIQKIDIQRDGFDSQKENLIFKKCSQGTSTVTRLKAHKTKPTCG